MNKKILVYGICLSLIFSLAGCGGQQAQEPQNVQQTKEVVPTTKTTKPETPSADVTEKVDAPAAPIEESQSVEDKAGEVGEAGEAEGTGKEETTAPDEALFTEVSETVYATGTVNLRNGPGIENEKVGSLNRGDSTTRIGVGIKDTEAEGWSLIKLSDGSIVYVSNKYLSTSKPVAKSSGSGGSGSSGGVKTSTPAPKPATPDPKPETPAESGNSGNEGTTNGNTGSTSAADQAARDAMMKELGGKGPGKVYTDEEVKTGTTQGSDMIYH